MTAEQYTVEESIGFAITYSVQLVAHTCDGVANVS